MKQNFKMNQQLNAMKPKAFVYVWLHVLSKLKQTECYDLKFLIDQIWETKISPEAAEERFYKLLTGITDFKK